MVDFNRLRVVGQTCSPPFPDRESATLTEQSGDVITVRLTMGTQVTLPKVSVNLGEKFLDFDSIESCNVLDSDSKYDLILDMS